jgi:hypothetical protein
MALYGDITCNGVRVVDSVASYRLAIIGKIWPHWVFRGDPNGSKPSFCRQR